MAIRCGLQAGMGAMIGLSPITEADMLSVIIHGQELLSHYAGEVQPIIIGMPAWNSITTVNSDNRYDLGFDFDVEGNFELLSAQRFVTDLSLLAGFEERVHHTAVEAFVGIIGLVDGMDLW